jgi:peptidyl-prolyl cis-trans isomerase B (cyclophilin B)
VAGKKERQRKLARERYERRLAREAQRQQQVRKITRWTAAVVVLLVIAGAVVAAVIGLGSSGKSSAASTSSPSVAAATPTSAPTPTPTPTPTGPVTKCTYIRMPAPPKKLPGERSAGMPPVKPDYRATYQATIKTNHGSIVIDLLNSRATCTVNSFVFLAGKNYFNNTLCPRLVTTSIYVLQCGDPTGTGSGGPGYEFADENLAGATYPTGTLAMANGGPNTNGSQFFLVYQNTSLPPSYTPFGTIVSGLNILQNVAKAGIGPPLNPAGGGRPKQKVVIESITIKKT